MTDPNNKTTRSQYDAAGRKVKSIDAANHEITYAYDSAGNIRTQTAGGQVTAFTYDKRNLQLSETLHPGDATLERVTANAYDNRGNRTQRTQPNGAVTNYTYDAQGRLLSAVQDGAPLETRSYTYNAAGAVTFVAEDSRATGYTLDKLGRTVEERTFVKNPLDATWIPKSVVTSTYDVVGNRLTVAYPENRGLSCTYDLRNLLTTVTDGTRTTVYGYDAAGNRTSMTMPNGVVASYTFDSNNRLTQIAHTNLGGMNLYSAQYTLDAAGMRTLATETGVNRNTRALTFGYDDLYQLTSEMDSSRNGGNPTLYTYDAMGNRLSRNDNGVTTTYTVDGLNRVTAATTGLEQVTYAYDANGNTASKTAGGVTRDYHYDRENRLVRVSEGEGDIFAATYDYRCRRLEKTENGDTVSYLYDGGVSVQEYDAEGSLTTYLVRAGGYGGGVGDVVYKEKADGTGREFFLYNATGTTSALTNDAGTVTSTSCYNAWGTETATVGTTDNVRKFSTKERSEVLGIDYFGFRYYDPELGRFITRDPSGYPDGPNNYLYCTNSPVNKIDPLGLKSLLSELIEPVIVNYAADKAKEISNSTSSPIIGGMAEFMHSTLNSAREMSKPAPLKVVDAAVSAQEHYDIAGKTGSNSVAEKAAYAAGMVANEQLPMFKGAVEAHDGRSYSSGDFNRKLEPLERAGRAAESVAATASTAAATLGATRAIVGNGTTTAVAQTKAEGSASPVPRTGPKGVDPNHHNANVTVRDGGGNIIEHTRIVSGNMSPAEQSLPFPQNILASHTEARAVAGIELQPNQSMTITGQRRPCPSCKGKMNNAVQNTDNIDITYQWRENGHTKKWTAGAN